MKKLYVKIKEIHCSHCIDTIRKSLLEISNIKSIEFDLDYDHYQDIKVKKDIPVKMIINVDKNKLTGCNNEILISRFNIKKKLEVGENIIYFTPDKKENITYTCWMNMIKNTIKVEN